MTMKPASSNVQLYEIVCEERLVSSYMLATFVCNEREGIKFG